MKLFNSIKRKFRSYYRSSYSDIGDIINNSNKSTKQEKPVTAYSSFKICSISMAISSLCFGYGIYSGNKADSIFFGISTAILLGLVVCLCVKDRVELTEEMNKEMQRKNKKNETKE